MNGVTVLVVWPLVALLLVSCGATFATSGRSSRPAAAVRSGADRLMVVIAPDDGGRTVVSAVEAAQRRGAEITLIGDPNAVAAAYDRMGRVDRDRRPVMNQTF